MKEKWQSIRGFFRKNSRKLIPLLLLAAILLPIVVDNSYVLGICTKILLYMLLASSVNVINGYIDMEGAQALDLFAGTGSISLELLSRGCAPVVSVEMDRDHAAFIRE